MTPTNNPRSLSDFDDSPDRIELVQIEGTDGRHFYRRTTEAATETDHERENDETTDEP